MARTRSGLTHDSESAQIRSRKAGSRVDTSLDSTDSTRPDPRSITSSAPTPPQTSPARAGSVPVEERRDGRVGRDDVGDDGFDMLCWGYTLVSGSVLALAFTIWSMVIGPHVGPTGWSVLDALVNDTYYKYLAVLLIPITTCFVIVNWWGLKIFRHA